MKRTAWSLLLMLALTMALAACGGNEGDAGESGDSADSPVVEGGATSAFMGSCTPSGPLRLFNWGEYMDPELLTQFGELYGVDVTEDNFSSNEELITKLRAGNSGYDLVFPSDYAVGILSSEGLLAELDKDNIPSVENLNPELVGLYYDPENRYSLPYQWGTTGIAYNSTYFDSAPTSWAALLDPATVEAEGGFFSMLDDEREALGAALKFLGYSVNDTDPAHIEEAKALLIAQKGFGTFSAYNSDNFYDALASEEVTFAHAWSGGTALAASQNDAIQFTIPQEGGVIWQDNMAIPVDAPNRCTAELFMNFVLDPLIAAQIVEYTYYNTPVPAAIALLSDETRALVERVQPAEGMMDKLEWIERAGDTTVFSDAWTEIKSR